MQFTTLTITALFGALAMAAPLETRDSEAITITDFTVRKTDAGPNAVSFTLSGDNATAIACSDSAPAYPEDVTTCGDTEYRFALYPGNATEYSLRLYHELGDAYGRYGQGDVPTYCRAGGASVDDFICTQVVDATVIVIGS